MPSGPPGLTDRMRHAATFSQVQHSWIKRESERYGLPFSEMLRRVVDAGRQAMMRRETENAHRS